ncbi:hypothetical protein NHX12_017694 [Muraenolepis orangiensis]|uniref:Nidogen n=1 Tax=Muraenolepis orangiensis TaxID=630683 RepID=A0A9Q0EYV2_9TELE|nr:hypothetical protein NHX12_017694 [Muraenolepis orangiensis]
MGCPAGLLLGWGLLLLGVCSVGSISLTDLFQSSSSTGEEEMLGHGANESREVKLDHEVFFMGETLSRVHIHTNGFISAVQPPPEDSYLGKMPASFRMLAVLLGDLENSAGQGKVSYWQTASPEVLGPVALALERAFPQGLKQELKHALVVTWHAMAARGSHGDGVGVKTVDLLHTVFFVEGLQFLTTPVGGESRPLEAGFNQGQLKSWWGYVNQGDYYRITTEEESSVAALAEKTNAGLPGVWVFQVGQYYFTDIVPGMANMTQPEDKQEKNHRPQNHGTLIQRNHRARNYRTLILRNHRPLNHNTLIQRNLRTRGGQRPEVAVVGVDLDVNVFSYQSETCSSTRLTCSAFADCHDYSTGPCCRCRHGFYGNGKDCVAEGKPQRMNGKVNGRVFVGDSPVAIQLSNNDLHSYVVANDGRAYVAISSISKGLGPALQPLTSLGGVMGWAFALEQPGYQNGFSLIGGVFSRQAEVVFSGGERLSISQDFQGIDEHDHLLVNTTLEGQVPEVPPEASISVQAYHEIYQHNRNWRYRRGATSGGKLSASRAVPTAMVPMVMTQQLSVDQIFVMYDADNQLIRYAMSNKIGALDNGVPELNPCFTGRHGCDNNAACHHGDGLHFTCECSDGFTGDGRTCYDLINPWGFATVEMFDYRSDFLQGD